MILKKFFSSISFDKKTFYIYFLLKVIILIITIYFLPIFFNKEYFVDNDFNNYYSKCYENSFNLFYTKLVCYLNIKKLNNFLPISIAFVLSFLRDIIFLHVARLKLSRKFFGLFFLILLLHPYLNIHYIKFTTIIFAGLAVALIFLEIEILNKKSLFLNIVLLILCGFRNSIFFLFLLYQSLNIYDLLKKLKLSLIKKINIVFLILFFLLLILFSLDFGYLEKSVYTTSSYYLNYYNFYNFINFIPLDFLRVALSLILLFLSHVVMLLGFREKAFVEFEKYFYSLKTINDLEILLSFTLLIFHFFGIYFFFTILKKRREYIFTFLISLIPFIFLVAHLRYFMPYIPLAIYGFVYFCEKKFLNYKL